MRDATLREQDPLTGNDLMLRVPAVVASQSRSSCGALSGWGACTSIPAEPSDFIRCHGFRGGKAPNRELDRDRLPRSEPGFGPDGAPRMRRHYGEADDAGEWRGMPGIGPAGTVPVWTNLERGGRSASHQATSSANAAWPLTDFARDYTLNSPTCCLKRSDHLIGSESWDHTTFRSASP